MKLKLSQNGFNYLMFGHEEDERATFKLWVNKYLTNGEREIHFPLKAKVIVTGKGNKVLKPAEDVWTLNLFAECNYKGETDICVLGKSVPFLRSLSPYKELNCVHNPALGISRGLLVSVSTPELFYEVTRDNKVFQLHWTEGGKSVLTNTYKV